MQTRSYKSIKLVKVKDLNLLCNYNNGVVIYVDDENLKAVEEWINNSFRFLPENVESYLEENNFFVDLEGKIGQAYLHVTDRCNMDCVGCYSRTSLRNKRTDMTLEQIKTIMDQIKEHGVTRIVISGGEPMLRKDIGEILGYGKQLGFEMAMISNGSFLIPDEVMNELDDISFSVDLFEKDRNILNRIMQKENVVANIATAKKAGTYVTGIVTLNAFNANKIDSYFKLGEELGIQITFSIFHSAEPNSKPFLLNDEHLRSLAEKCMEKMPQLIEGFSAFDDIFCRENCGAGKTNMSVDASGNLAPCHMLHNISFGSLLENSHEAWEKMEIFWNNLKTPSECANCDYHLFCGAGCKARALLTGDGTGKDPYCEMYKCYYTKQYDYIKKVVNE